MAPGKVLYTLGGEGEQIICPIHCNNVLEFYCSACKKSACKQCEHGFHCLRNQHDLIEMKNVVYDVTNKPKDIQKMLKETLDSIKKDRSQWEDHVNVCKIAIKEKEKELIKTVQEESKKLFSELEKLDKEKNEDIDSQIIHINEKLTQVNNVICSMNKPQEIETLVSHMTTINAFRDFGESFLKFNIIPKFTESTQLDELMKTGGIGIIKIVYGMYKVDQDDEEITVTKGQPFVVNVSSLIEKDACKLSATLSNPSHKESATEVEYQGNGEYQITGRCNVEGDWQMKIIAGEAHIKGSPVNIKVESLGLVHTIGNISDYKEHNKTDNVTGVVLDIDGCILVSSHSKDVLKFNQSGSFVARIQVPQNVNVTKIHLMGDGHMVYSDVLGECVVMCDEKYQEIISFGKGILKYPCGLTVNKETRVLYVADDEAHCVFKFNVDDGTLLGKIGSGQMDKPTDVTLTKEGHTIIADWDQDKIQMFDTNDKFMRILVGYGEDDGKVSGPSGVTMDKDENIIVSSNDKLQLFDKDGVFIKRLDHEDDGLDVPTGINVISNRPRRVAVANYRENNVKIFNY